MRPQPIRGSGPNRLFQQLHVASGVRVRFAVLQGFHLVENHPVVPPALFQHLEIKIPRLDAFADFLPSHAVSGRLMKESHGVVHLSVGTMVRHETHQESLVIAPHFQQRAERPLLCHGHRVETGTYLQDNPIKSLVMRGFVNLYRQFGNGIRARACRHPLPIAVVPQKEDNRTLLAGNHC